MSSVLPRRPAATPNLDAGFSRPSIDATLVPQGRTTRLRRTIRRVLGLRYPPVTADVADGDPHCLPAHAAIISHSVLWT